MKLLIDEAIPLLDIPDEDDLNDMGCWGILYNPVRNKILPQEVVLASADMESFLTFIQRDIDETIVLYRCGHAKYILETR